MMMMMTSIQSSELKWVGGMCIFRFQLLVIGKKSKKSHNEESLGEGW